MGIFSRYIFWKFFNLLVLTVGCSVVIFVVIDFVENTRIWLNRPQEEAWSYYLNYIPHIIYLVLPIAVLISAVFSVGNCARHLELVAMKAAGSSIYKLTFSIILFGALLSAAMYWYSDNILPDANHKRFKIKEPKSKENESGNPNEKYKFVFIGPGGTTYFFQHYSGTLKSGSGVTILQEKADTLSERWDAKRMEWDNHWVIYSGTHRTFPSGRVVATQFNKKILKELSDTPSDLVNNRVFPDEMTLRELERRIKILKRSGESTRRFETQWHFRISSCFLNLILVIIAVSVSANTARRGLILRFGVAVFLLFCHYILLRFGLILGENGELTPIMGAWMGNFVFGFLSLCMYWRMGNL